MLNYNGYTYVVGNTGTGPTADFHVRITGIQTLSADNFIGLGKVGLTGTANADVLKGTARRTISGLKEDRQRRRWTRSSAGWAPTT